MNDGNCPEAAGLYIHIPFCRVKCRFCDFAAYPGLLKEIPRYLKALETEMRFFSGRSIDTVFVGGGTPSLLEPGQVKSLFAFLNSNFNALPGLEASMECNPEDIGEGLLEAMIESGVNRLSFGLQAVQERLLKNLGRRHDFDVFKKSFALARSAGFSNINVDLMYGLPEQSLDDWKESIGRVLELEPEHVSAYALSVEKNTLFFCRGVETDGDIQADMYESASDRLEAAGFTHYEISNFARPSFECKHNLRYWKNLPCYGIGASSARYDGKTRRKNIGKVLEYMKILEDGGSPVAEETTLSDRERVGENLMLSLRLKEGVEVTAQAQDFYGNALDEFTDAGFLRPDGKMILPTRKGWLLSNQMFQEFL